METMIFTLLCIALLWFAKSEPRQKGGAVELWKYILRDVAIILGVLSGVLAIYFYQKSLVQ